jgi:hypothetical protein
LTKNDAYYIDYPSISVPFGDGLSPSPSGEAGFALSRSDVPFRPFEFARINPPQAGKLQAALADKPALKTPELSSSNIRKVQRRKRITNKETLYDGNIGAGAR